LGPLAGVTKKTTPANDTATKKYFIVSLLRRQRKTTAKRRKRTPANFSTNHRLGTVSHER